MKQILKTVYLNGGDKATLEYEYQAEVLHTRYLGAGFTQEILGRCRETYQIVIDYLHQHPIVFDVFVFRDSPEIWRKPIATCQFMDRELRVLLSDFHVEEPYYNSSIDAMCEQAKRRLGFWIEDRANFELAKMKL